MSTFKEAWIEVFRYWGSFDGCMSRRHYWLTMPFIVIGIYLTAFASNQAEALSRTDINRFYVLSAACWLCTSLFLFGVLLFWTHSVRRLHDSGHSGLWFLLFNIHFPYIGNIAALACVFLLFLKKNPLKSHKYGENAPCARNIKCIWLLAALLLPTFPISF